MKSKIINEDIELIKKEFDKDLQTLRGKKILITGGNGSMASYLVDIFYDYDCTLMILNKNPTTEDSRLGHLRGEAGVFFVEQDVGKPFEIPSGIDIIIHAASRANPTSFLKDPLDTIDANINGVRTLLEYAKDNPVENFIFFSSAEIYGNPVKEFVPTPETYTGNVDPLHPMSCYLESKRLAENLCAIYHRNHSVPTKMLRLLLSYGPGMRNDGKVISDFYMDAIAFEKISLRDKGDATRSFCYVSDTIRGILAVMFKGENGEAYNIGNDLENISILDLAGKIVEVVNNCSVIKPKLCAPQKEMYGEPTRNVDITKLRNLGYEPKVLLNEGLTRLHKHLNEVGSWK